MHSALPGPAQLGAHLGAMPVSSRVTSDVGKFGFVVTGRNSYYEYRYSYGWSSLQSFFVIQNEIVKSPSLS